MINLFGYNYLPGFGGLIGQALRQVYRIANKQLIQRLKKMSQCCQIPISPEFMPIVLRFIGYVAQFHFGHVFSCSRTTRLHL